MGDSNLEIQLQRKPSAQSGKLSEGRFLEKPGTARLSPPLTIGMDARGFKVPRKVADF
jgi:hypothetical protein